MPTTAIYNMTDTWNSGGTTYSAIQMNVTDSASAAASSIFSRHCSAVALSSAGTS